VLFVALLYGGVSMFMTLIPVVIHRRMRAGEFLSNRL